MKNCNPCSGGVREPYILDMDVSYTGPNGTCNNAEIKTGMSLRTVLDILVTNCDPSGGGGDATKWYIGTTVPSFPANPWDLYLQSNGKVWKYQDTTVGWVDTGITLGGGGGGGTWGTIQGNIEDQEDLVEYIAEQISEIVVSPNNAGENLTFNADTQKVDFGQIYAEVYRFVEFKLAEQAFIMGYEDPASPIPDVEKPRLHLQPDLIKLMMDSVIGLVMGSGLVSLTAEGGLSQLALSPDTTALSGQTIQISGGTVNIAAGTNRILVDGYMIWNNPERGPVIKDTQTGTMYRLQVTNGVLGVIGYNP